MTGDTFASAYALVARLRAAVWRTMAEHQSRWEGVRAAAYREWRGRNKRRKTEPATLPELDAPYKLAGEHARDAIDTIQRAIKAADALADAAAVGEVLAPSGEVWTDVHGVGSGDYASQGYGARKYAEMAAEGVADHYRALGLQVVIRHTVREYPRDAAVGVGWTRADLASHTYRIWVQADPVEADCARRKPAVSLREWVRLCWARGVNPRVYNPFLPHGFEERNGLDYFGGETRKAGSA